MIVRDLDPRVFLKQAAPLLYEREAEYNLIIGLTRKLLENSNPPEFAPLFLRLLNRDDQTCMAFAQFQPNGGLITHGQPVWIGELVHFLREHNLPQQGIAGPRTATTIFAREYCQTANLTPRTAMEFKILQLEQVVWPKKTMGEMMLALPTNIDQIVEWIMDFEAEAAPHERRSALAIRTQAIEYIKNKTLFAWMTTSQGLASIALKSRDTTNTATISLVYTPPELRSRGYASSLIARLSQLLLDSRKKSVVLNMDAKNPISNKIYEKVGFRSIAESSSVVFERANALDQIQN